jgi:hypothetical protein
MRSVSSGFKEAVEADVVRPFLAVEMLFDSSPFRVWNGLGQLDVDGVVYQGAASLLNISTVEETTEIAARGMTFQMSGIPSSMLSLAISEPYQGRVARAYFGVMSVPQRLLTESDAIITTESLLPIDISSGDKRELVEIFSGYMDVMSISDGEETAVITVTAESRLIALERPVVSRFTPEDQKRKYPNDKGFDFVADLQDKEIKWGGG